ncbi:hypothetical protein ACXHXG_15270 [Rhizobium sp. LEGMi198b]
MPQVFRFTLTVAASPDAPDGYVSALGDLTLMDIFTLPKQCHLWRRSTLRAADGYR